MSDLIEPKVISQLSTVSLPLQDTDLVVVSRDGQNLLKGTVADIITRDNITKLAGIASGATANSSDATLLNRANHTGTQTASTISDFTESVQDIVGSQLVAGSNVSIVYDDVAGTTTISASDTYGQVEIAVTSSRAALLSDANNILACNSASAINITVSPQSTTSIPDNDILTIYQEGVGASTFVAGVGVTIQGTAPTLAQYKHIAIRHRTGDIWAWV